ncbi:unnamed protein product [Agarophyton chilense]
MDLQDLLATKFTADQPPAVLTYEILPEDLAIQQIYFSSEDNRRHCMPQYAKNMCGQEACKAVVDVDVAVDFASMVMINPLSCGKVHLRLENAHFQTLKQVTPENRPTIPVHARSVVDAEMPQVYESGATLRRTWKWDVHLVIKSAF